MQIDRLFQIVYILLNKKSVTAKYLSEKFEVSQRTIYRDIDTLCEAGIPIYTTKGKGGGISLVEEFILNKALLSEEEQNNILASLSGLKSINYPNADYTLKRLTNLFHRENIEWIDVDFSNWGNNKTQCDIFQILKSSIFNCNIIQFDYFNSHGKKSNRIAEPIKLIFKGQAWYLSAFCRLKNDFRIFKISRMKNIITLKETFERKEYKFSISSNDNTLKMINIKLKIHSSMAYRVYDEFLEENIKVLSDGSFIIDSTFPYNQWIYSYILSYGDKLEVLEPKNIKNEVKERLNKLIKIYS